MKRKIEHKGPGSLAMLREALELYHNKGFTADRALNETFRHYKLRDERMRSDLVTRLYGIIRFRRPIVTALGEERIESIDDMKVLVDTFHKWMKVYNKEALPVENDYFIEKLRKYARVRKLRESMPDWLDEEGVKQLGEERWETIAAELNRSPRLFLRVNTLKISKEELIVRLKEEGVKVSASNEGHDALLVDTFHNVFSLKSFHEGLFELQDISSQRVSEMADVRSGMRVLDACAGNGGKTLHLAALMKNKGKIIAMDISGRKLEELRTRCKRNGVDMVETMEINLKSDLSSMNGTFDRVLLDVPCSGTGVLKRNPDIKWRLHPRDLQELQMQQQKILSQYSALLKPGGKLVYASCSIFPSEGEEQIKSFMKDEKWEKEDELRLDPVFGDGFFMSRLKKI